MVDGVYCMCEDDGVRKYFLIFVIWCVFSYCVWGGDNSCVPKYLVGWSNNVDILMIICGSVWGDIIL